VAWTQSPDVFQRYAKWIDDARDKEELKKMDALMASGSGG
jgi:hypothetical protein